MEALGFWLALIWVVLYVRGRGQGTRGMKASACFESLGSTLVMSGLLSVPAGLFHSQWDCWRVVGSFFVYSELLGIVGMFGFVALALAEGLEKPEEVDGVGISPLKGE